MLGARSPSAIVTAQSGKDTECSTDGTGLGAYRQCGTGAWVGVAGEANGGGMVGRVMGASHCLWWVCLSDARTIGHSLVVACRQVLYILYILYGMG